MNRSGFIEYNPTIVLEKRTKPRHGFLPTGMFFECTDTIWKSREAQIRICEKQRVKLPRLTRRRLWQNLVVKKRFEKHRHRPHVNPVYLQSFASVVHNVTACYGVFRKF